MKERFRFLDVVLVPRPFTTTWVAGMSVSLHINSGVAQRSNTGEWILDETPWVAKRERGFWFSSKNIENIKQDIANKASAYEAVRQAGKVNIDTIALLNSLLKQLDTEFGGRLFLPNLSSKENAMRATLYMNLVEKITTISHAAQIMYARTQGLDLQRLDEFFKMFGSSMGRTAATLMGQSAEVEEGSSNHLKKHFNAVVEMVMSKSNEYELQLPENLAQAIEESSTPKKKSKVN